MDTALLKESRSRAELSAEVERTPYTPLGQEKAHMKTLFTRFIREEAGQDLIEYALLAGFISLIAVVAITQLGSNLNTKYGLIGDEVDKIAPTAGS
jgi:pilus assembly protein Flp/PilA